MNIVKLSSLRCEHPEIEAQAQAWVIRLDGEPLSAGEKAELGEWLSRSPVHKRLFQEAARFWFDLDRLANLVFEVEHVHRQSAVHPPPTARPPCSAPGRIFAAAAMLALVALAGLLAWRFLPAPPAPVNEYATAVGEIRTVELADGSTLSLNTDTRVSVSYGRDARLIHLVKGEAVFEVVHEPARPFTVYVGRHAVRAVGTAFAILARENGVDVRVIEGRIEVSSFEAPLAGEAGFGEARRPLSGSRVPLDQGQRGIFNAAPDERGRVQIVGAGSLEQDLSWREGMLIFDNDSLETVVAEINRYTRLRVVISDSSIRGLRFGGHFRVGDIGAILATLEQDFSIQVDRTADGLVTLSRAR